MTGRRTIRLGLAQSTTTSVPTSSASPSPLLLNHPSSSNHSSSASTSTSPHSGRAHGNISYVNNHLIGRNLFDDVSAEEIRRDRGLGGTEVGVHTVNTQPQLTPQRLQPLSQSQQSQPSEFSYPSLVVNINNQIDSGASVEQLPPLGHPSTMRPPIHTQPTFNGVNHNYHNITPRSRMHLNHAASLMIEEIIGNAVEREQRMGVETWSDLHREQQDHLERIAPLC